MNISRSDLKRFIIIGAVVASLAVLLLFWFRGGVTVLPDAESPSSQATARVDSVELPVGTNAHMQSSRDTSAVNSQPQPADSEAELAARMKAERDYLAERDERMRLSNEAGNPPVSFYGLVVDQESNPLANVSVSLAIIEEYVAPYPQVKTKTTSLQKQTSADGRFEVTGTGLKGKYVTVPMLTKEGYEQEIPGQFETFGTQSTSVDNPAILRMWSTNIPHAQLLTGDLSAAVIPDGRRYGVDLTKQAIQEGAEGDLVVWLKRPAEVDWRKYDWSCELMANGGLLEETRDSTMLIAPESGYTNVFTFQQEAARDGWTHGLYGKRFYILLRNGQGYGCITVNLTVNPNRKAPAMLRVQYVVNPSGSRVLR